MVHCFFNPYKIWQENTFWKRRPRGNKRAIASFHHLGLPNFAFKHIFQMCSISILPWKGGGWNRMQWEAKIEKGKNTYQSGGKQIKTFATGECFAARKLHNFCFECENFDPPPPASPTSLLFLIAKLMPFCLCLPPPHFNKTDKQLDIFSDTKSNIFTRFYDVMLYANLWWNFRYAPCCESFNVWTVKQIFTNSTKLVQFLD